MKTGNTIEHNIAIVLSAGRGSRMHSDVPKQYMDLCGKPVIAWTLEAFQKFSGVETVILVTARGYAEWCRTNIIDKYQYDKVKMIVPGGSERYLSVWEGLKAARKYLPEYTGIYYQQGDSRDEATAQDDSPIVFIHDGARPLVDSSILERALDSARRYSACAVGMPAKDTIKIADIDGFAKETPDRSRVWQIQTPQAFSFGLLYKSYEKLIADGVTDVTDDAMAVERESSVRVKLVEGSWRNLKITTPEDMVTAETYLKMTPGSGF